MSVLAQAEAYAIEAAGNDFNAFLVYVGVDDEGEPFERRELDVFVWRFAEECFEDQVPGGIMLPMGSGKTTLACWRVAWEIGRDQNLLSSLVTYSADRARELVELVRGIINLPRYRRVFPAVEVLAGKDAREAFTVKRTGVSNNATCSAFGILIGTGVRTNFLMLDDVVNLKNAIQEPGNRTRVLEAIRTTWMSRHKLVRTNQRTVWLQTAYHMADAAAVLREDPESGWRWLIVRAEAPYEVLTWEKWEHGACVQEGTLPTPFEPDVMRERAKRMGLTGAARGLANRAVSSEECPFKPHHFEGPQPLAPQEYQWRVLFADPAGDATKAKRADTDFCAVVVIGVHKDGHRDVIGADRMRGSPSQQAAFIARKAMQYQASRIFQEAVKDEALIGVTQKALQALGLALPVSPVKPTIGKALRITQILEPALEAGVLKVCGDRFPELRDEALTFPAAAHDDLIDALAGCYEKATAAGPARHRRSGDRKKGEKDNAVRGPDGRRPRVWERGFRKFRAFTRSR